MIDSAEAFFAPMSVEEFKSEYWRKKPVRIKGTPEKIAGLFDPNKFFEYASHPEVDLYAAETFEEYKFHQIPVAAPQADRLSRHGFTIQCEDVHRAHPGVFKLASAIRNALGIYSAMEAGAFLSRPGPGFPAHVDPNPDIWSVQITGTKRWTYGAERDVWHPLVQTAVTPVGDPVGDPWNEIKNPDQSKFIAIDQEPGDIFYFPGGVWHGTETLGTEPAIHLVLASINETYADFFADFMRPRLLATREWREISGALPIDSNQIPGELEKRLLELKEVVAGITVADLVAQLAAGREERQKPSYRQSSRNAPKVVSTVIQNP